MGNIISITFTLLCVIVEIAIGIKLLQMTSKRK